MNPVEQRSHRTVTSALARGIEDVAAASAARIDALEGAVLAAAAFTRQQVGEERTHRLKLADEQRGYVDAGTREIKAHVVRHQSALENIVRQTQFATDLTARGFWGRVNWLITGR